jgi:hypothetical protein
MAITRNPEIPGQVQVTHRYSTQFNKYSIDGHTLHLRSEGDCLGNNKTGFRDNLGLFSGIFHNFFSDAAYHFSINQLIIIETCFIRLLSIRYVKTCMI